VKVTLWGTRGSIPSAGPETVRYGGNTACVEVRASDGSLLVLDAGSGIRRLGPTLASERRIDLLLSHLHMDHVQGLGFFAPFFRPGAEVHLWGPSSTDQRMRERLARYLSPPLFPVRIRDLPCALSIHGLTEEPFALGPFRVTAKLICHPGGTLGYRIEEGGRVLAYLPDHEPALGVRHFPREPEWTSGYDLARGADVLIHDAQYADGEYADHEGWGHSAMSHTLAMAALCDVRRLVTFHHDPSHSDDFLDALHEDALSCRPPYELVPGREGLTLEV
jgi:phosphoribosyl 1,2-cyclic phosphodiesterase